MTLDQPAAFGPYRIVGRLGRGAMGVVYRAVDDRNGREVALKVILPDVAAEETARARFLREAQAVARLQHRNIVTVLDCGLIDESPYIAMELLDGMSVAARLAGGEPLTLDATLNIVIQLCEGLQFAHDCGIVHRDVKPANIWLLNNGGVKLLDFGIAKIAGSTFTRVGGVVGSAAYMSPEQLAGDGDVDGRADVFAAGAVLYELLTGHRPFEAEHITAVMHKILHEPPPPARTFRPDIPREIEAALETALEKDRTHRHEQAADLGTELRLAQYKLSPGAEQTVLVTRTRIAPQPPIAPASDIDSAVTHAAPPSSVRSSSSSQRPAAASSRPPAPATRQPSASSSRRPPVAAEPTGASSRRAATAASSPTAASSSRRAAVTAEPAIAPAAPAIDRRWPGIGGYLKWLGAAAALVVLGFGVRALLSPGAPATFQFEVTSEPAGAAITFDGRSTGQRTPATLTLPDRPARVGLTLAGFEAIDAPIGQSAGTGTDVTRLTYALRRLLKVRSEPSGASISLDGRETGLTTPADVPLPSPAPSQVELRWSDQRRRVTAITPALLDSGEMTVALENVPAAPVAPPAGGGVTRPVAGVSISVRVTAGYPFDVTGCGTTSPAATDHELTVNAPCTLRLRAPEYLLDTTRTIDASSGRIEIAAPQLAHVQLRTRFEWCTVVLGGRAVGSPPVDLDLVAGTYTATIQCPDRTYSTRAFTIDPGRSVRRLDEFLP